MRYCNWCSFTSTLRPWLRMLLRCANCPALKRRQPLADSRLDQPAWQGAKHSARTELAYLRATGQRVGPGHPWFERAHRRKGVRNG
jgi:hypothetical protein